VQTYVGLSGNTDPFSGEMSESVFWETIEAFGRQQQGPVGELLMQVPSILSPGWYRCLVTQFFRQLASAQRRIEATRVADVCCVHERIVRHAAAGLEDLRTARSRKLLLYTQRSALKEAAERVRHYRAKAQATSSRSMSLIDAIILQHHLSLPWTFRAFTINSLIPGCRCWTGEAGRRKSSRGPCTT
jgi:hypothetical protein